MGLSKMKRRLHADWPIRVFYGLITFYQGLFGIFLPSSIFHRAVVDHPWATGLVAFLLVSGALLVVDGLLGMVRYCTDIQRPTMERPMMILQRWRHLLFLPPAFCYFAALLAAGNDNSPGAVILYGYHITLAMCGVVACLRDGVISNRCGTGAGR